MADATLKMILLGQDRGASKALKNVGDEADRTERRSGKLAVGLGKVGKVAALGLAGGIAIAGVAAVKFAKAAADDQQQAALLAKQLKNSANATDAQVASTEKWISAQGVAKGVSDDELRPALATMVRALGDVGAAQSGVSMAMDISAGTGKSLQAVTMALAKAQNGNVGALGRLGIATKDAAGHTLSLDQVTRNLDKQFSGAATTSANTFQGKVDRLKLVLRETGESIGYKLLPILTDLATWILNKAVPAIQKFFDHMQSGQGAAGGLSRILSAMGTVIKAVAGWVKDELIPATKHLIDKIVAAMGGTKGMKDMMNSLKPVITLVVAVLKVLWTGLKWAADIVLPLVAAQLRMIVIGLGKAATAAIWLWNKGFQPALKFIVQGIAWVIDKFADLLGAIGHIKGFGWAKDAADKLHAAANKANDLATNLKKIPTDKKVKVSVTYSYHDSKGNPKVQHGTPGHGNAIPQAVGSRFFPGGMAWVGERGPEMVELPRGSRIHTAQDSARGGDAGTSDLGTATLVIATDDGRILEKKLMKLKRDRGGMRLGFV